MTRDINKAAEEFEKMIRKELGGSIPIAWSVVDFQKSQSTISSVSEFLTAGFGGSLNTKSGLVFDLPAPHLTQLHIGVIQPGINTFPATLMFTADLSRPISGKAVFVPGYPGSGIFQGDQMICEKLNGNKEVIGLSATLHRGKVKVAHLVVEIPPYLGVTGDGTTSQLLVRKVLLMKGFATLLFQAKEFLQLSSLIETLL
jgi:hypothetical protein